jgi:hypothetical protein
MFLGRKIKKTEVFFVLFLTFQKSEPSRPPIHIKGIVQPFELGGETRLIRSAVKY